MLSVSVCDLPIYSMFYRFHWSKGNHWKVVDRFHDCHLLAYKIDSNMNGSCDIMAALTYLIYPNDNHILHSETVLCFGLIIIINGFILINDSIVMNVSSHLKFIQLLIYKVHYISLRWMLNFRKSTFYFIFFWCVKLICLSVSLIILL